MNFDRIKKNYDTKLWTKDMVKVAVKKGIISKEQYYFIVGEDYES